MQIRGIVYVLCATIAFILSIVAVAVNVATVYTPTGPYWFTLWASSNGSKPTDSGFGNFNSQIRAARAFIILTILCIFPGMVLGALDAVDIRPAAIPYKLAMVAIGAINFVWSLLAWPILFGLPHTLRRHLPSGTATSITVDGSPIVMFFAWLLIIPLIVVPLVLADPAAPASETQQQPSGATQATAGNATTANAPH